MWAGAFVALAALDLYAVASGHDGWRVATKPPLMVLLAATLVAVTPNSGIARRWFVAGLLWSALGDTILLSPRDAAFAGGTLAFAAAHVCFIVALARLGAGRGFVLEHPWIALPYAAAWLGSAVLLGPRMGALAFVAIPYGLLLTVMALTALDLIGRIALPAALPAAAGGIVFLGSDGTIALARFDPGLAPQHVDVAIMLSYLVAQMLLAASVALAARARQQVFGVERAPA